MSLTQNNLDSDLSRFGFVVVGKISSKLIEKLQTHLQSKKVSRIVHRHSQLEWNSDCDAIFNDFETSRISLAFIVVSSTSTSSPIRQPFLNLLLDKGYSPC
ncbi:predicted protein [Histoplasma mississippiense (nom. inval.)]|uniref:predicted protein n=1 Tax=Ajellomyces capsulatus (strain NAm1 / WU24) TaxID=2059318 RepID=UPI000157C709|nr:predicted protein [Histoplasma mississippiense (nom. inval.)]EDN08858.1 predicted protein [Histoplasma mississippiense (nom. inval.)]